MCSVWQRSGAADQYSTYQQIIMSQLHLQHQLLQQHMLQSSSSGPVQGPPAQKHTVKTSAQVSLHSGAQGAAAAGGSGGHSGAQGAAAAGGGGHDATAAGLVSHADANQEMGAQLLFMQQQLLPQLLTMQQRQVGGTVCLCMGRCLCLRLVVVTGV